MANSSYWLIAALLLVLLLWAPSFTPRNRPRRLGRDPGLFKLRIWLARIDFLLNGRKLIEKNYLKVDISGLTFLE